MIFMQRGFQQLRNNVSGNPIGSSCLFMFKVTWRSEAQALARPSVEFGLNVSEASLADIEKVCSLGKILAHESVEVFDTAFFP